MTSRCAALLLLLALAGCGEDERPCLRSETRRVLMPMLIGRVIIFRPAQHTECLERAPASASAASADA